MESEYQLFFLRHLLKMISFYVIYLFDDIFGEFLLCLKILPKWAKVCK